MKYSEYLELEKLLKESNIHIDDVKENPSILNEFLKNKLNENGLLALLTGGALLAGITAIFGKNLLRLGIKSFYLKQIKSIADKFRTLILEKTSSLAKKTAETKISLYSDNKELMQNKEERKNIQKIDEIITKELRKFIDNISESKSKEVYALIDEQKKLKENQRLALKGYWDSLLPDIRIEAFNKVVKDGIIKDREVIKNLNIEFKNINKKTKKHLNYIQNLAAQTNDESKSQQKQEVTQEPSESETQQTKQSQSTEKQTEQRMKKSGLKTKTQQTKQSQSTEKQTEQRMKKSGLKTKDIL